MHPAPKTMVTFLTPKQAAEFLGLSVDTLARWRVLVPVKLDSIAIGAAVA
jgi:hypothetical protein